LGVRLINQIDSNTSKPLEPALEAELLSQHGKLTSNQPNLVSGDGVLLLEPLACRCLFTQIA
jgi:hypothetical protein